MMARYWNISLMCPEQHLGVRFLSVGTRCAGLQLFQHYNRSFFFKYTEMLISFCFYPAIYWISFPVLIVFTVVEIYTESKFSVFAHYTVFTIRKKIFICFAVEVTGFLLTTTLWPWPLVTTLAKYFQALSVWLNFAQSFQIV